MTSTSSRSRRIAILGGGGFIGTHVAGAFLAHGDDVLVIDRQVAPHLPPAVDQVQAELSDLPTVTAAIAGAHSVICLASSSLPATANAQMASEIRGHVEATIAIAQAAANLAIPQFLFASSGGTIYGANSTADTPENTSAAPLNAYGVSKLAIEHYLRVLSMLNPLRAISLRLANPYGIGQRPERRQGFVATAVDCGLRNEPLTIWGDGSVTRDFVYVSDVADAFVAAADYSGEFNEFNIGSGQTTSLLEVIEIVENRLGSPIETRFESGRPIDVQHNGLAVQRAKSHLGWEATTSLVDGVAAFVGDLLNG